MREVTPPAAGGRLARSVVACLASILEVGVDAVPLPDAHHPAPWTLWRNWLARRGLGLVPVAEPARFSWPGPWLALLPDGDGGGEVAVVAFGAPPGVAWRPLGGAAHFAAVRSGFVVAPADVALWTTPPAAAARTAGRVEAIAVAPAAGAPMMRVQRAVARAGAGLVGDRYADGRGTFSDVHGRGHDLTLIEGEVLDALELPGGRRLPAEEARRNVVTRGVDLDALIGRRFAIGGVQCVGERRCEPCAHLERLTDRAGLPGTLRALVHRGGLRADIVGGGEIRVGDPIVAGGAAPPGPTP
jgi:MOSC domain-containing protein YiiM